MINSWNPHRHVLSNTTTHASAKANATATAKRSSKAKATAATKMYSTMRSPTLASDVLTEGREWNLREQQL